MSDLRGKKCAACGHASREGEPMSGDTFDLAGMGARVTAAIERAEAEALRAHEAGECHLSEWSCSHCEAAAERMGP